MRKFINDSRVILFIDISIVACSFFFAYLLRFNFQIPQNELAVFKYNIFVFLAVRLLLFYLFKIHTILFKYTSTKDARNISQSILVGTLLFFLINAGDFFLNKQFLFPTSILLIEMVFLPSH